MPRIVTVATAAAVLGLGLATYSLIRSGGQIGRIDLAAPAQRVDPIRMQEPRAAEPAPAATPRATPAERAADLQSVGLTADERSPFGHAGVEQTQPDHETTIAEGPPRDADGDATRLAPP